MTTKMTTIAPGSELAKALSQLANDERTLRKAAEKFGSTSMSQGSPHSAEGTIQASSSPESLTVNSETEPVFTATLSWPSDPKTTQALQTDILKLCRAIRRATHCYDGQGSNIAEDDPRGTVPIVLRQRLENTAQTYIRLAWTPANTAGAIVSILASVQEISKLIERDCE